MLVGNLTSIFLLNYIIRFISVFGPRLKPAFSARFLGVAYNLGRLNFFRKPHLLWLIIEGGL